MHDEARHTLTGLFEGTVLQSRLADLLEHERRPAALAVIDIDNFKSINDQQGRDAGDLVIRGVGRALAETAERAGDGSIAVHLRGDEFALLFPERDTDEAFAFVEEARRRVQDARLGATGSDGFAGVTISAGIASSPRDATGITDLLRKAEDGLWRAKKGSRNRIGLPSDDRMVLKSTYYATAQLERLGALAAQRRTTEASLLREALDDLLRKYADR